MKKPDVNLINTTIHKYQQENPNEEPHAIRNVVRKIPELKDFIFNSTLLKILGMIDAGLFLTKAIFFDKSPDSNWYVTWHQDVVINVKERIEAKGYSGWTKKYDVHGVSPPEEILKDTLTIRIHLDDTSEQNGALKIIPGSQNKKLDNSEIQLITQNSLPFICEVEACGIHIMKPLLLHASSKSTSQKHRRVLHLEFNTLDLAAGLQWAEKINLT